jgi:hypothetical protein
VHFQGRLLFFGARHGHEYHGRVSEVPVGRIHRHYFFDLRTRAGRRNDLDAGIAILPAPCIHAMVVVRYDHECRPPEFLERAHFAICQRHGAEDNQIAPGDAHHGHAARELAGRHVDRSGNGQNIRRDSLKMPVGVNLPGVLLK